jgi:hypothetical protein
MNTRHTIALRAVRCAATLLALLALCGKGAAQTQVMGQIMKIGDHRWIPPKPGKIRWRGASKVYAITDPGTGVTLEIALNEVGRMNVIKPPALNKAISDVKAGRFTSAVAPLEQVVKEYRMLQHDVTAAEPLAIAYNNTKRYKDTVTMIKGVQEDKPAHLITRGMVKQFWKALLETEQFGTLRKDLDDRIPNASRDVAAEAQNMRGDIDMKKGNPKAALLDGYLRTVVLFQDVKATQPEAIYKAMLCFEKLGQDGQKEKMRKKLLAEFPQSQYSRQVR